MYEYPDPWVKQRHGLTLYSGDYVRKDALTTPTRPAFAQLREERQRRAGFNTALYLAVAGDTAAAENAYTARARREPARSSRRPSAM